MSEGILSKIKFLIIVVLEYVYLLAKGITPAIILAIYFKVYDIPITKFLAFLVALSFLGGVIHELILRKK